MPYTNSFELEKQGPHFRRKSHFFRGLIPQHSRSQRSCIGPSTLFSLRRRRTQRSPPLSSSPFRCQRHDLFKVRPLAAMSACAHARSSPNQLHLSHLLPFVYLLRHSIYTLCGGRHGDLLFDESLPQVSNQVIERFLHCAVSALQEV